MNAHPPTGPAFAALTAPVLIYDADCGFCRWSVAKLVAWDRHGRVRLVALQEPEADRLLRSVPAAERSRSAHFVDVSGRVYSGGAATAPLMATLPGGRPFARVAHAFPRVTARAYRWVADHRELLGRAIPNRARSRVDARLDRRRGGASSPLA